MSYLETPTRYITVANKKIAYRELGEGNSDIPLCLLYTSFWLRRWSARACATWLLALTR